MHCTCLCFFLKFSVWIFPFYIVLKKSTCYNSRSNQILLFKTVLFLLWRPFQDPFVFFFLLISPFSSDFSFNCAIMSNGRKINSFFTDILHYPKIELSHINCQKSKWHRVRKQSFVFLKAKILFRFLP